MDVLKNRIMDSASVERCVTRMAHEINERCGGAENVVIIGIKRRGVCLARMIADRLGAITGGPVPCGELDVGPFRDDRPSAAPDGSAGTSLPFSVEGRTVIITDDVLYTGRTVRAAIGAVFSMGRPAAIRLAVLVDRGHRELPFRADFVGKNIPTSRSETVRVLFPEFDGDLGVELYGERS